MMIRAICSDAPVMIYLSELCVWTIYYVGIYNSDPRSDLDTDHWTWAQQVRQRFKLTIGLSDVTLSFMFKIQL